MERRMFPAKNILLITVLLALLGLFCEAAVLPAFAEDITVPADAQQLKVVSIEPVYVERGATTYMVTLRAHVINNSNSDNVSIEVTGKDADGYILQNIRFSGTIDPGKQRMMMERFQIRGEIYEKISSWEAR